MTDTSQFKAERTRETLVKRGFLPHNIVRYCYRPFDVRWLYWEPETKLLDRKRADYFPQVQDGNPWIAAAQRNRKDFDPLLVSARHCSRHVIERGANLFSLYLVTDERPLFEKAGRTLNLSDRAAGYLADIRADSQDLFYHTLAILHAAGYGEENSGALHQDWPRIPLPKVKDLLVVSAELGRQVAALLDSETQVSGVTTGKIRDELKRIGVFQRVDGKPANPEAGDLDVTAGWGHAGKGGVTMPGKGKLIRRDDGAWDVYLNDLACWRNIPDAVWNYTIGGYQVIKKWLSYREKPLLGRGLKPEEVRYVTEMARRLAALIVLQTSLDANYREVKQNIYPWGNR